MTCTCSQGGEAKDDGEAKDVGDAASPLMPAFSAGPAGQLEALSLADFSGWTALHWACSRGLPEVRGARARAGGFFFFKSRVSMCNAAFLRWGETLIVAGGGDTD